jgi:hypothetical protein
MHSRPLLALASLLLLLAACGRDGQPAGSCPACGAHAACSASLQCQCDPGYAGDGQTCQDVAVALGGLRWELPCTGAHSGDGCPSASAVHTSLTLGGDPAKTYNVTLRFRGVVELLTVTGGEGTGYFRKGGVPTTIGYNRYSLTVGAPGATYYLNAGTSGPRRCFAIDYTEVIAMAGGAAITLTGDPVDGQQILNIDDAGQPIVVPDIPPAPKPFDGQFIQMDVVSVSAQ